MILFLNRLSYADEVNSGRTGRPPTAGRDVWWEPPHDINESYRALLRRSYFDLLYPLIRSSDVRRAVLLMGPRRVGKTVLIHHIIEELLRAGVEPNRICYISVDHPIYNNLGLVELLDDMPPRPDSSSPRASSSSSSTRCSM